MSVRVVHLLESIEVEHQQREGPAMALGAGQLLAQAIGEEGAVRQSRHAVPQSQAFDVAQRLRLAALREAESREEAQQRQSRSPEQP